MKQEEFEKIACQAINAAQKVIFEAGITDLTIHELGFVNTESIKSGGESLTSEKVYRCPCWDCTSTNGGSCICNGPACSGW